MRIILVIAMFLIVAYSTALAQERYDVAPGSAQPTVMQYDNSGSRAQEDAYEVDGDGVLANPPIDPEDIIGWYWDCFYPDSAPHLVSCGWNPIYSPDVPRVGYAQ